MEFSKNFNKHLWTQEAHTSKITQAQTQKLKCKSRLKYKSNSKLILAQTPKNTNQTLGTQKLTQAQKSQIL